MSFAPKRGGKKRSVALRESIFKRALAFADKHEYTVASVIEAAIEEFLDDRADSPPAPAVKPRPAALGPLR